MTRRPHGCAGFWRCPECDRAGARSRYMGMLAVLFIVAVVIWVFTADAPPDPAEPIPTPAATVRSHR